MESPDAYEGLRAGLRESLMRDGVAPEIVDDATDELIAIARAHGDRLRDSLKGRES